MHSDMMIMIYAESLLLLLIQSLLVELLNDRRWNLGQALLRVQRQQLPCEVERVIEISALVLALSDEFVLKLFEELEMVEILFSKSLYGAMGTS